MTNDQPPPDKAAKPLRKSEEQQQQMLMIGNEVLKFSSVGLRENKCHSIHSPPFLDFLKPSFDFGVAKKPPSLKGKTINKYFALFVLKGVFMNFKSFPLII